MARKKKEEVVETTKNELWIKKVPVSKDSVVLHVYRTKPKSADGMWYSVCKDKTMNMLFGDKEN